MITCPPDRWREIGERAARSVGAEFGRRLGRPQRFLLAGIRPVVAFDAAVPADEMQGPAVGLGDEGDVARAAVGGNGFAGAELDDVDLAVADDLDHKNRKFGNATACYAK